MLANTEGISSQRLSQYKGLLREHNITGPVLLNCDLGELKSVLQMAFGDWELFRASIESLRHQEHMGGAGGGLLVQRDHPHTGGNELTGQDAMPVRQNLTPIMEGREGSSTGSMSALAGAASAAVSRDGATKTNRTNVGSSLVVPAVVAVDTSNQAIVGEVLREADFLKGALEAAGLSDAFVDNDPDDDFTDSEVANMSQAETSSITKKEIRNRLLPRSSSHQRQSLSSSQKDGNHSDSTDSESERPSGKGKKAVKVTDSDRTRIASLDYQRKPKRKKTASHKSESRSSTMTDGMTPLLLTTAPVETVSGGLTSSPPSPQPPNHKFNRFSFPIFGHHGDSSAASSRAPSRSVSRAPSHKRLDQYAIIDESDSKSSYSAEAAAAAANSAPVSTVDTVVQFNGESVQVRNVESSSKAL